MSTPQFRLRRLVVHRFRHVVPGSTLEFGDGMVAILGRNGTGKTNLLELLGAIWAWDFSAFGSEALHVEYEFVLQMAEGREATIEVELRNERVEVALPPGMRAEHGTAQGASWQERCTIVVSDLLEQKYTVRIEDGAALVSGSPGDLLAPLWGPRHWAASMFGASRRSGTGWKSSPYAVLQFPELEVGKPVSYDMMGGRVRFPEDTLFLITLLDGCQPTPTLAYDDEGNSEVVLRSSLLPSSLAIHLLTKISSENAPPPVLVAHAADSPTLAICCHQLNLENIEIQFNLFADEEDGEQRKDSPRVHYGNLAIYVTLPGGARFPIDRLSHGEKRFFCLLWYLALTDQVAIIDELANGLHHELVEHIVEKLKGRQSFLAMQDPLVLDHMTFDSAEHVRRSFILCEGDRDPETKRKRWRWHNPTPEEAADLMESWEVGIQQVHELLLARGLW